MSSRQKLRGILFFWSETGTEGGYWAFQDERFITPNTTVFGCTKCFKYWDKEKHPDGPPANPAEPIHVTKVVPLDKVFDDLSSEPDHDIQLPPDCQPEEHDFQPIGEERWSYDGLCVLKDGDYLTIFSKDNGTDIIWSGYIQLKPLPLFTETAFGMWIHADQEGLDREIWARWFMESYPAELILGPEQDRN